MSAIPQAAQQLIDVQQQAVQQQVAYAVAGKALDSVEQQGDAAVALVEQAAQLGKAVGAGGQFDKFG